MQLKLFSCYTKLSILFGVCRVCRNAGELAMFETMARHVQLLEERCSHQLADAECGTGFEQVGYEMNLCMGNDRTRGRALVSPALEEWIAAKLRDEASSLKGRRKGREERQLARNEHAGPSSGPTAPRQTARDGGRGRRR